MHGWSLLTALMLVLGDAPAPTEAPIDLTYEAEPGCPSRERVLEQLANHLATRSVPRGQARAIVRAERRGQGWEVAIAIEQGGTTGSRTLTASTCEAAADAAALVLAIAVAPAADDAPTVVPEPPSQPGVAEPGVPEPAGPSTAEPAKTEPAGPTPANSEPGTTEPGVAGPASPTVVARPSARLAPRRRPVLIGQFEFRTAIDGWALPAEIGGLGLLSAALRHRRVAIELAGAVRVPRTVRNGDLGASYRFGMGLVTICPVAWSSPRVELPICVSTELGRLRAEGRGGIEHRPKQYLWFASALGPGLWWWPSRYVGLSARLEVVVPWRRRDFVIGDRAVGRIAPAGARAQIGLVVRTRPLGDR